MQIAVFAFCIFLLKNYSNNLKWFSFSLKFSIKIFNFLKKMFKNATKCRNK